MSSTPVTFTSSSMAPVAASKSFRKASTVAFANSSSQSWWAPLFGWQPDPDYITDESSAKPIESVPKNPRFAPGCFTEEKARELRRKTAEGSTFHDVMYHSAIASRLASDVPSLPEKR